MAPTLATHLLMPDFAAFTRQHPEIEMEIHSTLENVNLTNREADVALRVVFNRNSLAQNLHGVKGPDLSVGVYMSRDLLADWTAGNSGHIRWISKNIEGVPEWAHGDAVKITGAPSGFQKMQRISRLCASAWGYQHFPASLEMPSRSSSGCLARAPMEPFGSLHKGRRERPSVSACSRNLSDSLRAHAGYLLVTNLAKINRRNSIIKRRILITLHKV
jgi:hypothetical protein